MQENIIQLNESIQEYEAEQQSFKKLAKLTWKATKGKFKRRQSK
jgi:hypothetical protein